MSDTAQLILLLDGIRGEGKYQSCATDCSGEETSGDDLLCQCNHSDAKRNLKSHIGAAGWWKGSVEAKGVQS